MSQIALLWREWSHRNVNSELKTVKKVPNNGFLEISIAEATLQSIALLLPSIVSRKRLRKSPIMDL